jgi:translation initiation factor 1
MKKDDANPFAKLAAMRDALPPGPATSVPASGGRDPNASAGAKRDDAPAWTRAKIVVRFERKGHGGKTVTIVSGVSGGSRVVDELASEMKKALGCGARVEDGDIVLQGDLVPRALAFLEKRGANHLVDGTAPKGKQK